MWDQPGFLFCSEGFRHCFCDQSGATGIGVDGVGDQVIPSFESRIDVDHLKFQVLRDFPDDWKLYLGVVVIDAPTPLFCNVRGQAKVDFRLGGELLEVGNEVPVVGFVVLLGVFPVHRFGVIGSEHDDDDVRLGSESVLKVLRFLIRLITAVHKSGAA